jgi:hypothetical protein
MSIGVREKDLKLGGRKGLGIGKEGLKNRGDKIDILSAKRDLSRFSKSEIFTKKNIYRE